MIKSESHSKKTDRSTEKNSIQNNYENIKKKESDNNASLKAPTVPRVIFDHF
jgi:hypothetical protein